VPRGVSEPSRFYWAAGIAASLALHASAVAGAVMLGGRYVEPPAPTEITFTDEASPAAATLPAAAEAMPAAEAAAAAEPLAPSPATAETAAAEPLKPFETAAAEPAQTLPATAADAVQALKAEQAASAEVAQPIVAAAPEPVQPATAAAALAVQPAATAALQPETAASASAAASAAETLQAEPPQVQANATPPEAIQPSGPTEATAGGSAAEKADILVSSDAVSASQGADRLQASVSVAVSHADEAAERVAALDQAPGAEPAPTATAVAPAAASEVEAGPPAESVPAASVPAAAEAAASVKAEAVQPATTPAASRAETAAVVAAAPEVVAAAQGQGGAGLAETLQPSAGSATVETASALPAGAEIARPAASAESVAGVSPMEPQPAGEAAGVPVVVVPAETPEQPVEAAEQPEETAMVTPDEPKSGEDETTDDPAQHLGRVVNFVRQYSGGGNCFMAVPAETPDGDVAVKVLGHGEGDDAFAQALESLGDLKTKISSGDVSDPQCLALSFARQAKRYPSFSLSIVLDEAAMAAGRSLSGKVLNPGGLKFHLYLIDGEGQVMAIDRFMKGGETGDRPFEIPALTLTDGSVITRLMLFAIAADPALPALTSSVDKPIKAFFLELGKEIDATHADVDLAVEGFDLR
jgi:hypothetical protein